MAKVLSIIAREGYQNKEYGDSRLVLEEAGHTVITCSDNQIAYGAFGGSEKVDVLLDDVKVENYDAVIFIGGQGCFEYFEDETALRVARNSYVAGKLTCAICAAPAILANAGILKGKKVTSWPGVSEALIAQGANYTGMPAEHDGLIITGSGPMAAVAFGEEICKALQ